MGPFEVDLVDPLLHLPSMDKVTAKACTDCGSLPIYQECRCVSHSLSRGQTLHHQVLHYQEISTDLWEEIQRIFCKEKVERICRS